MEYLREEKDASSLEKSYKCQSQPSTCVCACVFLCARVCVCVFLCVPVAPSGDGERRARPAAGAQNWAASGHIWGGFVTAGRQSTVPN